MWYHVTFGHPAVRHLVTNFNYSKLNKMKSTISLEWSLEWSLDNNKTHLFLIADLTFQALFPLNSLGPVLLDMTNPLIQQDWESPRTHKVRSNLSKLKSSWQQNMIMIEECYIKIYARERQILWEKKMNISICCNLKAGEYWVTTSHLVAIPDNLNCFRGNAIPFAWQFIFTDNSLLQLQSVQLVQSQTQ